MTSLRISLLALSFAVISLGSTVFAQTLEIIPQATNPQQVAKDVEGVAVWGHVWEKYNTVVAEKRSLSDQLSSGIMDWTTILDYFARFIKYLSQLGIFIGSCFVIYAGYVYATAIFQKSQEITKWKVAIENAIIGVIVITFSYAIMKGIMAAFL